MGSAGLAVEGAVPWSTDKLEDRLERLAKAREHEHPSDAFDLYCASVLDRLR